MNAVTVPRDATPDEAHSYELRVTGLLGPVLLATLPHTIATRVEGRTTLIVQADRQDLVDILERIVGSGLEVESVRDTEPGNAEPAGPRDA